MAYCPQCNGVLDARAVACPQCGYDFPPPAEPSRGLAYSRLADVALFVGMVVAGLGAAASVVGSVVAMLNGEWLIGLVICPLTFFLKLALLVVFVRVQRV